MFISNLIKLRKQSNLSQEFMADGLGVARATYIKLETGQKSPTLKEIDKLAQILGVGFEALISSEDPFFEALRARLALPDEPPASGPRPAIKLNLSKLRNVLLYVLGRVGAQPNMGETVLYKLIYFIDFDYYEKFGRSVTGIDYRRNHYGPTPGPDFRGLVEAMVEKGDLKITRAKFYGLSQKKYLAGVEANLQVLDGQEVHHIDEVLNRLGSKTAQELTYLAHQDMPWLATKPGETIDYQLAKYRTVVTAISVDTDEL